MKIKIFTLKEKVTFPSEQLLLYGLLDDLPEEKEEEHNFKGEPKMKNVIKKCKELFIYVDDVNECDIIIFPYKYKESSDKIFLSLMKLANKQKKKLFCFFIDDNDRRIIPKKKNVILYRTSFYRKTKQKNEFAIPAFFPDYYSHDFKKNTKLSIGFCGHTNLGRLKYLNYLSKSNIETDFIIRTGFWAPGIDKLTARREYIENMRNNLFIFCFRGTGNFCYRFYETLMMGKIPVLINTDRVFPFEECYELKSLGIIIDEQDLSKGKIDLETEILNFYHTNKNNLIDMQKNNRKIWEDYFSPKGFINHFYERCLNHF
ncbi:MAG: hypothetical protein ACFFAO_08910, partial [Candidatus Hermodarchaeota archaeon]